MRPGHIAIRLDYISCRLLIAGAREAKVHIQLEVFCKISLTYRITVVLLPGSEGISHYLASPLISKILTFKCVAFLAVFEQDPTPAMQHFFGTSIEDCFET